jgi:7-cyano-7-deazaguanine synthase
MKRVGLVLLSGGLDSATAATLARAEGYDLVAVTVQYGQAHVREVDAAREIARELGIKHRIVDVTFFKELAWYSALTHPERFAVPTDRLPADMSQDIPITYVPLRNTLFLALGAAFLESEALWAIETQSVEPAELETVIFIAANAIDYSGYPDCRPEYYQALAQTLRLGSKLGTQYGVPLQIRTPLIAKTKAEIVRLAAQVGAPINLTWSCYEGGALPCGRCDSCVLRAKGFEEAGTTDPVAFRTGPR